MRSGTESWADPGSQGDSMTTLFTSEYLGRLERFVIASRAAISSPMPGRRPGHGKGFSVEFADYREYYPGDDLRYVDWNVYRRMGKLFLRLFRAESELTLHLLVDTSRSMGYGAADKLDFTRRVAAALAFVGVSNLDRVSLATFSNKLHTVMPAGRGRPHLFQIFKTLENVQPEGKSDLNRSLREYGDYSRTPGLAVVLSDCFDPGGCEEGLRYLSHKRFGVVLVHVFADEEVSPAFDTPVELLDLEDAAAPTIQGDPESVERYKIRFQQFRRSLEGFCRANGMNYVPALSSLEFEDWVFDFLRKGVWHVH